MREEDHGALASSLSHPELLRERVMTAPALRRIGTGRAVAFSTVSPNKDTANEDAALLLPVDDERCVLAVADGVGGHAGGAEAARIALNRISRAVRKAAEVGSSLREALLEGIERANAEVLELKNGAATTLAVAELDGREVRTYHAGDSPLLVLGQRGRIKRQTIDHSPVGYAVEAGVLDASEAIHHRDRHLISNAIGVENLRVEMSSPLKLAVRDTLVIASDGLFDNLHTSEIVEFVRKGPLLDGVELMIEACQERMAARGGSEPSKPDDLTVVAFRP